MARTRRVKSMAEGKAHYHLISRACNRQFLFRKARTKDKLVELVRKAAEFSGIDLEAAAMMDNHIHILCTVVHTGEKVSMDEVIRRIRVLKGDKAADLFAERCGELAAAGFDATLEAELDRYRARMNDISEFMKTVKELFAIWFNREFDYCGSVWSGVFKSTMVEGGIYLARCRRYIILNPVRAGIVSQIKDYRWVFARITTENEVFLGCLPSGADGGQWCENVGADVVGRALMRRVPQLGEGKIYGSAEFVGRWIAGLGDKFPAAHVCARAVGEIGFASHGWRIAERAKCGCEKAVHEEPMRG